MSKVGRYLDSRLRASTGPARGRRRGPARHPEAGLEDGSLLGHQVREDESNPTSRPTFEMRLTITDDPGYRQDLANALERWQTYLEGWVLPRIFAVAEGGKAPIVIARRIP